MLSGTPSKRKQKTHSKDEQIRLKAEQDLRRKKKLMSPLQSPLPPSKVVFLKNFQLISSEVINSNLSVSEIAKFMALNRVDAVPVVNEKGMLSGIVTDIDLTFRFVASKGDPGLIRAGDVMTKSPKTIDYKSNVAEALNTMLQGNFRHLPVIKNENILGLLDLTFCVSSVLEQKNDFLLKLMGEVVQVGDILDHFVGEPLITKSTKMTVYEAAVGMLQAGQTSMIFVDEKGRLKGIMTTKDIVLRVLAAGLDPWSTSVVRVVTPQPDVISPEMSVIEAVRQMNSRNYTHLPVVSKGKIIKVIDLLKLSHFLAAQMEIRQLDTQSSFWNTSVADVRKPDASENLISYKIHNSNISFISMGTSINKIKANISERMRITNFSIFNDNNMPIETDSDLLREQEAMPKNGTKVLILKIVKAKSFWKSSLLLTFAGFAVGYAVFTIRKKIYQ